MTRNHEKQNRNFFIDVSFSFVTKQRNGGHETT